MSGFFRRFFLGDFGPPPSPDLSHQPSIAGQSIVEILYSNSKYKRAVITHDALGVYRIHMQSWDTSDWKGGHGAFWYGDGSNSFTDNVEQARKLACEELGMVRPDKAA